MAQILNSLSTPLYSGRECFPDGSVGKDSACNAENPSSILGLGRSLGEGNGNPLQYSCLENPIDRGSWWAMVHWITKELDTMEVTEHAR